MNPYRWNVLLDALIVNTTITPGTTKMVGAPANKAVVLLDSGSSYTSVLLLLSPVPASDVPLGMHHLKLLRQFTVMFLVPHSIARLDTGAFPATRRLTWLCRSGTSAQCFSSCLYKLLTVFLSGQVFPLHPLDVSPRITADANSKCIGSFVPQSLGPNWDLCVHSMPYIPCQI